MTDTSPETIARVLALAEKATPGPWRVAPITGTIDADVAYEASPCAYDKTYVVHVFDGMDEDDQDVQYITAAHPAFVTAALRELERLREATRWRPLSSAPRDGTLVLVRVAEAETRALMARRMVTTRDVWISAGREIHPTHWQPLPSTEVTP